MVVVTGDHGEGLGERHWAHGWDLYNEDIRIPLLLYDAPGPARRIRISRSACRWTSRRRFSIASACRFRRRGKGESLLAPSPQRFTQHQTYFVPNRFAVLYRDGDALFKFIATPQYGKEELYDLRKDVREQHDLVSEKPALAGLLREALRF